MIKNLQTKTMKLINLISFAIIVEFIVLFSSLICNLIFSLILGFISIGFWLFLEINRPIKDRLFFYDD